MQLQDIGKLLGLQDVKVKKISHESSQAIIHIEPSVISQLCPCCQSTAIIKNGKDGHRRITHLRIAETQCILLALSQRLKCKTVSCKMNCPSEKKEAP